ncbi:hypothetical protein [Pseudomonas purpurea]|uniref:hypothetical protein n=1 Tax=Pseudomonas purpurea TaxID=3136737 RepID=UPI003263D594
MSSIGAPTSGNSGLQPLNELLKNGADDEVVPPPLFEAPVLAEGIKVSLSGTGLNKSSGAGGADSDIEESGLPDNIQQILKMIRKLQRQLAEKMAELQAVMADKSLSPEQMRAKVGALQSAITGISGGLITANASLAKAMKQAGLSADQVMKAASLLMKP